MLFCGIFVDIHVKRNWRWIHNVRSENWKENWQLLFLQCYSCMCVYKIFALQSVSNVILNNFILGICGCLHLLRLSLAFYLQAGRMESDIPFLLISCIIFVLMPEWWLTSYYRRLSTTTVVSLILTEWPTSGLVMSLFGQDCPSAKNQNCFCCFCFFLTCQS